MSPDWGEHAVALVGLLAGACICMGGIIGWFVKRELSRLTSSLTVGLAGVTDSIGKVWDKIDTLSTSLHAQGESLAKLWGAHEARESQGGCGDGTRIQRSGKDRRQA